MKDGYDEKGKFVASRGVVGGKGEEIVIVNRKKCMITINKNDI
jgi:hypothetical protein